MIRLGVLLTIAIVFVSDPLFGDKGRVVMTPLSLLQNDRFSQTLRYAQKFISGISIRYLRYLFRMPQFWKKIFILQKALLS